MYHSDSSQLRADRLVGGDLWHAGGAQCKPLTANRRIVKNKNKMGSKHKELNKDVRIVCTEDDAFTGCPSSIIFDLGIFYANIYFFFTAKAF